MAATTSAQLRSIAKAVISSHPQYMFVISETAHWSPTENTVYYRAVEDAQDIHDLFHELGHAVLAHHNYTQDIELIRMEREAWSKADLLAQQFDYRLDQDLVEDALDSYREWLHARSRCPKCSGAGIQNVSLTYTCPLCNTRWRANDARQCRLSRRNIK